MSYNMESRINSIIENSGTDLLNYKNVNGFAFGYKYTSGTQTDEPALLAFVSEKLPEDSLNDEDIIPKTYYGVKTDVIEVGEITAHSLTARLRPMLEGYSIGPAGLAYAGTAGCMVKTGKGLNVVYYILSNNHVLANQNTLPINSPILNPATIDGGVSPNDIVAALSKFIPIQFTTATSNPYNKVDCAIAKITNTSLVSNQIALIGYTNGIGTATLNLPVKKAGRTSGLTSGTITSTNATVQVTYNNNQTALFTNQIITTAMSQPGDSGSLVLDSQNRAIGLLFAGSSTITILNPIVTVLSALGVSLV